MWSLLVLFSHSLMSNFLRSHGLHTQVFPVLHYLPKFPQTYDHWKFSSVQSLSHVWLFATPWTAARQASLFSTNSRSTPKPMSIESMMPSNHLILSRPLLLLPSIFPSIRVFSNELALRIRWPKYWSFSLNISPSNEHPGLISFTMDWLDFLAVQGTLKSLLQHHSSKVSILRHSAFFIVQLSHPYMTTGKTIAFTRRTLKLVTLCYHLILSSSVASFFCSQSSPAIQSFPVSWLFASGGQNIGVSLSESVLPMNIQGWFPSGLTGLISLKSKELSGVFSNTTVQQHQFFDAQPSLWSNSHIHTWLLEKP